MQSEKSIRELTKGLIRWYDFQKGKRALDSEFSYCFIEKLRNEKELSGYHQLCRRDWGIVNVNRNRLNDSENEYERLFKDIFKGAWGRQLYLFWFRYLCGKVSGAIWIGL